MNIMKFSFAVFLLTAFLTVVKPWEISKIYAKVNDPVFILEGKIINHLGSKPHRIQKYYVRKNIHAMAKQVHRISTRWNISSDTVLSIIELESNFNPRATRVNTDGSIDRGLTQQNSVWVQNRCRRKYKRNCSISELYHQQVSIELMTERFKECKQYLSRNDELAFLVCYNSSSKAIKYRRTRRPPKYLKVLLAARDELSKK